MTLDQLGQLKWSPTATDVGIHRVEITVSDDRGGGITQSYNLAVHSDGQTPRVGLFISANPARVGTPVTFAVTATDNVAVAAINLTINGNPVPLDANGRITLLAEPVGDYAIVASASDAAGNTGLVTTSLLVIDTSDVNAPVVNIASPADGTIITNLVDVIGTATDEHLLFYTLEVAPLAGGEFVEIFRGNTNVVDSVLGKFDPTTLANDTYRLRLSATDAGGNTSFIENIVEVAGDLKIGNFTLSFTDLSIPVSGIPITVTRTYDSLNAGQSDDLGFGWRLEFRDTDLRTSLVPPTPQEIEFGIFPALQEGTRVYVTLPGGQRQAFTFRPKLQAGFAGSFGFHDPVFVPDPGVTNSLTVPKTTLIRNEFGEYFGLVSGGSLPYNPMDSLNFGGKYFLTTSDGLTYEIDALTGDLNRLADTSSNVLTFTDTAIVSNTGQRVTFERDPRGRITAAIDPAGNRVEYSYDAAGDLVSVTDRDQNITRFVYNEPTRSHYLTEIIDPLGRTGVRTEYDDQGRLIQLIDADGQNVQLIHDPDNFIEIVRDPLGNPTVFEYHPAGGAPASWMLSNRPFWNTWSVIRTSRSFVSRKSYSGKATRAATRF